MAGKTVRRWSEIPPKAKKNANHCPDCGYKLHIIYEVIDDKKYKIYECLNLIECDGPELTPCGYAFKIETIDKIERIFKKR